MGGRTDIGLSTLSAHCQSTTRASGHEVGGPRGAWAIANQILSVGFSWRRGRALNTPSVERIKV
jgi:hypothetical protein